MTHAQDPSAQAPNLDQENEQLNPELQQASDSSDDTLSPESEVATVEDLQAQVKALAESLKLEKARAANAIYEAEKTKERISREADTAKKFALEKFAKSLLETVDNLERAIDAAGEDNAILEGVRLTHKVLLSTLSKFDIVAVDTENGFSADFHQAVGIDPNAKAGEIGSVLQKGYTIGGRLLRPAMVMVGQ